MQKKFETKPNSGALFAVKIKKTPNQPDYRGDLLIDLSAFEVVNNQVAITLGGWKKVMGSGGTMLSLSASKPYVAKEQPTQRTQEFKDDEIDF